MQEWIPFIGELQCQREEANEENHYAVAIMKITAGCTENQGSWPRANRSM